MPSTLSIESYGDTHALILRDRGGVFELFTAESSLPAADQYKACENVRDGIRRAVGAPCPACGSKDPDDAPETCRPCADAAGRD